MALMRIGNTILGEGRPTLMFAEEGQANQGDIDVAFHMCKTAASAGVDGIELQLFLANDMYIKNDPGYTLYKSRELSISQIRELISATHEAGLLCQVAGFSPAITTISSSAKLFFCIRIVIVLVSLGSAIFSLL